MANNRMYVVCLHCLNDDSKEMSDCQFYLAKYYPTGGWLTEGKHLDGVGKPETLGSKLDEFFASHLHKDSWEQSMYGDHFTIITESLLKGADDFVASKRGILEAVVKGMEDGKVGK